MRRTRLGLLGFLPGFVSLAVAGNQLGSPVPSRDDAASRTAFLEVYQVFMHPRCVNCHPAGDAPLQGEDSRPHASLRLRRGADGQGVFAVKCGNCHQVQNQPGLHMPPGAPYPLKDGIQDLAHFNEPRWHMPPAATPMVFEKRSPGQLCRQLLDKKRNGGLNPDQLFQHVLRLEELPGLIDSLPGAPSPIAKE